MPEPSRETPLQGGCLCGAVRFQITAPLISAGYCHCTHCQRRTGTGSSANGRVPQDGFELVQGTEQLRAFKPPTGVPKLFCATCGSALFSGDPFSDEEVAVRLGALDADPGIRPQYRQFLHSAVTWERIPDDGLARYPGSRLAARPSDAEPARKEAGSDAEVAALIATMRRDLAAAPEIYRPGNFWDQLIASNLEMLQTEGIDNLKRTVSNNYYNWLVTRPDDPQMQRAALGWLRRPTLAPLINHLEEPPTGLRTLTEERSFSLSRVASWPYKFFVGALWETARREDGWGLTERLSEPEVGNPIRIRHRGRLISQDLANSIIEFAFAARSGVFSRGSRVAELGAGYGRLAYVLAEACAPAYCIFDIPPALAVSQWYLTSVLGPERVVPYRSGGDFAAVEERLRPGTIAFFTPDQLETFPDGWFDCTQTISTLPEMPAEQARHYLSLLASKSGRAVFLKQWMRSLNTADDFELTEEQYLLPEPWRLAERRVDPIQPAFFNQLWLRQ